MPLLNTKHRKQLTNFVLCKNPKYCNRLLPLEAKIQSRIPLYTVLMMVIVLDLFCHLIYAVFSYIVGKLMIVMSLLCLIVAIVDALILTEAIKSRRTIFVFYLSKLYSLLAFNILCYVLSLMFHRALKHMNILFVFLFELEGFISCFVVWSAMKNKIVLNEFDETNN
mmetsp:Transcript_33935/g.35236  ORF Transcript_33935/g.35236 Transcript_33935/m.35236 type:complete len:167 (-) Transcript_33935:123-623(-)